MQITLLGMTITEIHKTQPYYNQILSDVNQLLKVNLFDRLEEMFINHQTKWKADEPLVLCKRVSTNNNSKPGKK